MLLITQSDFPVVTIPSNDIDNAVRIASSHDQSQPFVGCHSRLVLNCSVPSDDVVCGGGAAVLRAAAAERRMVGGAAAPLLLRTRAHRSVGFTFWLSAAVCSPVDESIIGACHDLRLFAALIVDVDVGSIRVLIGWSYAGNMEGDSSAFLIDLYYARALK